MDVSKIVANPRRVRRTPIRGVQLRRPKPGGNFWAWGPFLGERVRESLFTPDRGLADLELARRLKERVAAYQGRGKPLKATYGEAHRKRFGEGRHSEGTIRDADAWLARIGADTLCENIDWEMVEWLAKGAIKPGSSESTLRRVVATVKATLGFAHRHFGLKRGCPVPDFPVLKEGKPRNIYLEPKYCTAMHSLLVREGHQLAADVLCITLGEGARRGELHAMSFRFIDMARCVITLRDTKSSGVEEERDRTISDPRPWTMETLRSILDRRTGPIDAVFVQHDGKPYALENSFGAYINNQLRRAAKAVGVPDWDRITLHVLRHTAATNHYLLTGDILEVEVRFDWYDGDSARRYVKKVPKQLAPEVAEMYGLAEIWHNPHSLVRFNGRNPLPKHDNSIDPA